MSFSLIRNSKTLPIFFSLFCFPLFTSELQHSLPLSQSTQSNEAPDWTKKYKEIRNSLTQTEIYSLLDKGIELASKTTLTTTLSEGGTAFFPHCDIKQCGDQIAAVVYATLEACKNTGKNQVLLIGVMHALTDTLKKARQREREENILNDPCRGIFGPGLPNEELFCKEFSLDSFIFLLYQAAERNGLPVPKIVIRYPYLVYGQPEHLPGIEELKQLSSESIVVATGDLCHHGTAYTAPSPYTSIERKIPISEEAYDFAYHTIQENLRLLSKNDLLAYRKYCFETISDTFEVGQMLRFLLGPLEGHIYDLKLIDVSEDFPSKPKPNWVAATLVELKKIEP